MAPVEAGGQSSTLDFLLLHIHHKSDFPALSDSVVRIQRMATSEAESVNSVANEILKDVALTNILRIAAASIPFRGRSTWWGLTAFAIWP